MSDSDSKVAKVYAAASVEEQRAAYDDWAASYERDLFAMGYRLPAVAASVFARFVPPGAEPILDAGCGGGAQAEPLALLGYRAITGIDLSEGMLSVARSKGIYSELKQLALGAQIDLPEDHFAAVLSTGAITPGHAPPESFDGLIKVAKPGAPIVFGLRVDEKQDPAYPAALARLEQAGAWRQVFATGKFQTMPYGEPEVWNAVYVYEAL